MSSYHYYTTSTGDRHYYHNGDDDRPATVIKKDTKMHQTPAQNLYAKEVTDKVAPSAMVLYGCAAIGLLSAGALLLGNTEIKCAAILGVAANTFVLVHIADRLPAVKTISQPYLEANKKVSLQAHEKQLMREFGVVEKKSVSDRVEEMAIGPDRMPTDEFKKLLLQWQSIRFIGMQGSGKTSKALWLCRERIKAGHRVLWFNPHLKAEDAEALARLGVQVVGGGRNYKEIEDTFTNLVVDEASRPSYLTQQYDRFSKEKNAQFLPVTFVVDELTNYSSHVGKSGEIFIKASVQEFSKINWHTIAITHNDTLSCMCAPAGIKDALTNNYLDLYLEADPSKGNRIPKPIGKLRMPGDKAMIDVEIPKWMQ